MARAEDQARGLEHLVDRLELRRSGARLVGEPSDRYGPTVFGGFALAIVIRAALADAPPGTRLHSIHAHFLRPMRGGVEVDFVNEVLKAGRTFTTAVTRGDQEGRPVISAVGSFTRDGAGDVYDQSGIPDDVAPPEELPEPEWEDGDEWPWDERWVGPTPRRPDGTYTSTHRHWFRMPDGLGDDPALHAALLGYATDWTGTGGRPRALEGDTTGMISLDHAAWFHRPTRVDDWHLQDVHCLVNAGGRGVLRGVIKNRHGEIVASMAQEMLLRAE